MNTPPVIVQVWNGMRLALIGSAFAGLASGAAMLAAFACGVPA